MNPKTETQKRVVELSATLEPISPALRLEALGLNGDIFVSHDTAWCSGCGHEWIAHLWGRKKAKCPNCGHTEPVVKSPRRMHAKYKYYYEVPEVCKEFQVIRAFIVDREIWKDGRTVLNSFSEVFQHWVRPDGLDTIIARSCRPMSYYIDLWNLDSPLTLKGDHNRYYPGAYVSRRQRLIPDLRRNGLRRIYDNTANPVEQVHEALTDPFAEMLLKAGRSREFQIQSSWYHKFNNYEKNALRICIRHGYKLSDIGIWRDYIQQLVELNKDIHNPFYVCPPDLKAAHDRAALQVERKLERERMREAMEEAERDREAAASYEKRCGCYFCIVLTEGDLTVEPLRSIEEFAKEGVEMHHCVMTNKYYAKEDCLIMSAKIRGERAATLEIRPSEGRVVQCRAKCNKVPEQYGRIVSLVERNMKQIQNARKKIC